MRTKKVLIFIQNFRLDSNSSSQQSLSQNNEYTGSRAGSVLNNNGSKLIHGNQNSNNNNNNNNHNVTVNGGKYINDKFSNQNNKSKLHAGHSFVQKPRLLIPVKVSVLCMGH